MNAAAAKSALLLATINIYTTAHFKIVPHTAPDSVASRNTLNMKNEKPAIRF
ncbi:hypothetical protein BofuT4_uP123140.1 [Botrytis cinerea T4]|uniref:Uncharacterized protein n=1 Tax=Botryotinia fuckeliana (strain T4) TaxID=999810 RepID=G2YNU7_BOTF4|nr:hypothetical protein BofuT4_uP123140.1 [Botrytis cinerea T4]